LLGEAVHAFMIGEPGVSFWIKWVVLITTTEANFEQIKGRNDPSALAGEDRS
jgi:hypothetical protein